MSTPKTLMLRLRDEDINTTRKFDESLLPENFETGADICSPGKDDKFIRPVKLSRKYIKIYVHWNGSPDDCAQELLKFDTYDKVLNLLLLGNCSCINSRPLGKDGFTDMKSPRRIVRPYLMDMSRNYDENSYVMELPKFGDTDKELRWTEYAYKFVNGEWFVKSVDKDFEPEDWTPLKEVF